MVMEEQGLGDELSYNYLLLNGCVPFDFLDCFYYRFVSWTL